ncbi:hypothetical protein KC19_10G180200 [Ceratodon purpureus]|uniref:Glycosyl hydrolase family 32 N-terminal domain-containing protein n=3 Tax=Ceratodon purpureus TaxID=3225 RepID=A0A8T0GLM6_CERPU|nr:hypothetical protein KC19_10G180200 [Ceratodon purpureus]
MDESSPDLQSQQDEDLEGSYSKLPAFRRKQATVSSFVFYVLCSLGLLICVEVIIFSRFLLPLAVGNASYSGDRRSNVSDLINLEPEAPFRTSFHFQPPKNWMNDPNGPMYYKGFYHLFYQYNPWGAVWGNLTWGHAVSEDLLHWLDLEPALKGDQWYDVGGVWSGSVTFRLDGTPIILYTGLAEDLEQTQNMAVPDDASDPFLRKWVKSSENPLLRHPDGVYKEDFRDPSTAWQVEDGSWRITIGTQVETDGMALVYKSRDLLHWELEKNVLYTIPGSGMWECLDFYPVAPTGRRGLDTSTRGPSVNHVLKVSSYNDQHDYYAVGSYNEVTQAFTPVNQELGVLYGLQYDYGKFYASKSFYDPVKKRRILWGWSNESDTEAQDIAKGWASLQAIPRTVWLDSELGDNLIQAPIEELKSLRGVKVSKAEVELEAGSILRIEGSYGGQLDIEVTFEYPDVSKVAFKYGRPLDDPFDCSEGGSAQRGVFGPFGLLVMADDALQEQTALFFYISQSKDRQWSTYFCSDQSRLDQLFVGLLCYI